MQIPILPTLLAGLVFFFAEPANAQASRINRSAQALAGQLGSTPMANSHQRDGIGALKQRMIAVLESLEASAGSNGPPPASLIRTALEFRNDLGDWERQMLTNALVTAWTDARSMGLFDEHGKFQETITKGRDVGDACVFELIVPGELYPQASNQLSNVRIVRAKEKRSADAPVSPRDEAYRDQFTRLAAEKANRARLATLDKKGNAQLAKIEKGPETNAVGQTAAQHLALWEKEITAAGESAGAMPNIRVSADVQATPSHMNQQRWRVACEVVNLSKFPTEVTVEVWVLGVTDKKRSHYVMVRKSETMKLRSSESRKFDVFTAAEGSYKGKADDLDQLSGAERARTQVRFRGCVIQATHAKGVAGFAGSDRMLTGYVDPSSENSPLLTLPRF